MPTGKKERVLEVSTNLRVKATPYEEKDALIDANIVLEESHPLETQ